MRSSSAITSGSNIVCFRCGGQHLATNCALDRNITCRACGIKGHLQKDGIHYCGHYIDKNGTHKEQKKMETIENMPQPRNTTELRAFLGLINYYGRFIRNVSTILNPRYKLLEGSQEKKIPFNWNQSCKTAFQEAKRAFVSNQILTHFDTTLQTIVACDASPYGVGAILSQKQPDGSEWNKVEHQFKHIVGMIGTKVIQELKLPLTGSELSKETEKDISLQPLLRTLQKGTNIKPSERFNIPLKEFSLQNVDAYTKWPEAYITKDLTSYTTIRKCKQIFSTFGFPKIIVSDNGRHFTSNEFATFVKTNGIIHKTTAPFHPATNGQAERFVQTLKLHLKKKFQTGPIRTSVLEEAVQQIFFQYRTTPHVAIDMSPAERMDRVQCRNYYRRTKWIFGRIEKSLDLAHYFVRLDNGKAWKRHVNQILKTGNIPSEKPWDYNLPDYNQHQINRDSGQKKKEIEPKRSPVKVSPARTSPPKLSPSPRRSERPRAPPERYGEIIWH
ncbi:uncharacterized protein [Cardiocondyla obscurior]|uniref:uncharacterized protein n=1 Tax=Cardiocondyla obscurior TaxID=286306 RepID=UPI00396562A2